MKTSEELRLAALLRAQKFCEENETALNLIDEYAALKAELDSGILKIKAARAINEADITSKAAEKGVEQLVMVDVVYKYMLRAAVKAHALGDVELELSLDHPKTYMLDNDDATVGVKATEIKDIIKNNALVLTNILPSNITDMEAAILAYESVLAAPKEAIDNRSAKGTTIMTDLLNEADVPKNNLGKVIHSYLEDQSAAWDNTIKVGQSTGVRHTSIAAKYVDKDTKVVLKGVKATATNGVDTIEKYSTALGWVRFYSLDTDSWTLTSEHATFATNVKTQIGVDGKQMVKLAIELQKNAG